MKTYPFVLVHGIMNFDLPYSVVLGLHKHTLFDRVNYFKNIRSLLASEGYCCEAAQVPFSGFLF
jgi:hypothetical protein